MKQQIDDIVLAILMPNSEYAFLSFAFGTANQ